VLGDIEQFLGRVEPAVNPVRAAGKRNVAVGVDHPRDDRRAARVDDVDVSRKITLVGGRTDPDDTAPIDEDAHAFPQRGTGPVSEGRVSIQGGSGGCHGESACVASLKAMR
jgi:hypothetical protein